MRLPPSKASSRSRVAANTGLRDGTQGLAAQSLRVLLSNSVCRNVGFTARLTLKPVHTILLPASIQGKNRSNSLPGASGEDVQALKLVALKSRASSLTPIVFSFSLSLPLFFSFSLSLDQLFLFSSLSLAFHFSFSGVPLLFLRRSAFCRFRAPPDWRRKLLRATRNPLRVSSTPFPSSTLRADTASHAR